MTELVLFGIKEGDPRPGRYGTGKHLAFDEELFPLWRKVPGLYVGRVVNESHPGEMRGVAYVEQVAEIALRVTVSNKKTSVERFVDSNYHVVAMDIAHPRGEPAHNRTPNVLCSYVAESAAVVALRRGVRRDRSGICCTSPGFALFPRIPSRCSEPMHFFGVVATYREIQLAAELLLLHPYDQQVEGYSVLFRRQSHSWHPENLEFKKLERVWADAIRLDGYQNSAIWQAIYDAYKRKNDPYDYISEL